MASSRRRIQEDRGTDGVVAIGCYGPPRRAGVSQPSRAAATLGRDGVEASNPEGVSMVFDSTPSGLRWGKLPRTRGSRCAATPGYAMSTALRWSPRGASQHGLVPFTASQEGRWLHRNGNAIRVSLHLFTRARTI